MSSDFIRIAEGPGSLWTVLREPRGEFLLGFKIKSQAIAFARAVAFSGKLQLFIDDSDGNTIRPSAAGPTPISSS
jgi:hypothetical protein